MNKPSWLDDHTFAEFLKRENYVPRCIACLAEGRLFDLADLTIDHIVPRHLGGTRDLSNLQCLCRLHNSRKGTRPDSYWTRSFYFDTPPNLDGLRTAHRLSLYDLITADYRDWFDRPASAIAGVLYVLAWIVGAGKTIAIPVIGWALNRAIHARMLGASMPRVARILVLTKGKGLRDQIALELGGDKIKGIESDLTRYRIASIPPQVRIVQRWSDLSQGLDNADIWVSTVQMFFEKNGQPRSDLVPTLAQFDVIVCDELHFAHDQVQKIVSAAPSSLCFGTSCTPIDPYGSVLNPIVLLSTYGYDDAVNNDQSLKYLSTDVDQFIEEIDIVGADVLQEMRDRRIHSVTESSDYGQNVTPALSIALRVLRYLRECDAVSPGGEPAPHRPKDARTDLTYPVHAMLTVSEKLEGYVLLEALREFIGQHSVEFPEVDGYRVDFVVSDDDDENGQSRPANRLEPSHPWFATWQKYQAGEYDGRMASGGVRILICLDMGREGINNPLCGVIGTCYRMGSDVEVGQRPIGRQLRGFQKSLENGTWQVPPAPLDQVKIITHAAFENREILEDGIKFLLDMPGRLSNLKTIDDLVEQETIPEGTPPEKRGGLSMRERFQITCGLGAGIEEEELVVVCFPEEHQGPQRDRAREWIKTVRRDPQEAAHALRLDAQLKAVQVIRREDPAYKPTDDDLRQFIVWRQPDHAAEYLAGLTDPMARKYAVMWWEEWARGFRPGELRAMTSLNEIRRQLGNRVLNHLGSYLLPSGKDSVFPLAGTAMFTVLGTSSARQGSVWDTPQVHARLSRRDVQQNMLGWVVARLIDKGHCPSLEAIFGAAVPV